MSRPLALRCCLAVGLLATSPVWAVAPDEDALFGGDDAKPAGAATPTAAELKSAEPTGADLGEPGLKGQENTALLTRDRLQIGGFFYMRNFAGLGDGGSVKRDLTLGQATLFDTYLDGRINDQLRAYVRPRVLYNPTNDVPPTGLFALTGATAQPEFKFLITQMWLKWDVRKTVFFTVGQQFVRWGATRLWNPVDVINPARFNPLTFFDERTGLPMVRLDVPFAGEKWNWALLALTDNALTADRVGLATRIEGSGKLSIGEHFDINGEAGVLGRVQRGTDPKLGAYLSAQLGEVDLTSEFGATLVSSATSAVERVDWSVSAGAAWTWAYRDDDALNLSAEYFHNPSGVGLTDVRSAYQQAFASFPKVSTPAFTPFYTGRDYLALVATVISPGNWSNTSLTALGISNLTDGSGIARLQVVTLALTDLTVEMFGSAQWGDGELRGYVPMFRDLLTSNGLAAQADALKAPLWGAGLNLRVEL